ncbi:unnamed protein product [Rhizoctonia solani]|uniref:Uncharacterized protein n=1 Tax=Rhizoctonia solani TaxID=456999 RepID=A0A8H3DKL4_9AGAM|nr:unnamed protein product [Rhizoctonia solani]
MMGLLTSWQHHQLALQPLNYLTTSHLNPTTCLLTTPMYPYGPFQPFNSAPQPTPQPGPTHIYYNRGPRFMHRGPRRLVWFGLGGLATYWFIQSRERKHQMIMNQGEDAQRAGHCHGAWGWGHWGDHRREMKDTQQKMEEQHRNLQGQFKEFGGLNSDKLADMADSSLDSVLNSVVALKAKIAEQRAASQAARASSPKDEPRLV